MGKATFVREEDIEEVENPFSGRPQNSIDNTSDGGPSVEAGNRDFRLVDDDTLIEVDDQGVDIPQDISGGESEFSVWDDIAAPVGNFALDALSIPSQMLGGGINALEEGEDFSDAVTDPFTEFPLEEEAKNVSDTSVRDLWSAGSPYDSGELQDFFVDAVSDPINVIPIRNAFKAAGKVIDLAKNNSQKLLGVFFGVPYADIKVVAEAASKGIKAKHPADLKNVVDEIYQQMNIVHDQAKGRLKESRQAEQSFRSSLKAKDAEDAKDFRIESMIESQIVSLKSKQKEAAEASNSVLENFGGEIDHEELIEILKSSILKLYPVSGKKIAINSSTKAAEQVINATIRNLKDGVTGTEAKGILDQLRRTFEYNRGELFETIDSSDKKILKEAAFSLRKSMGEYIEGYDESMIPLAKITGLLDDLKRGGYRDQKRMITTLNGIVSGKDLAAERLLRRLEEEMGTSILSEISNASRAKKLITGNAFDYHNELDSRVFRVFGENTRMAQNSYDLAKSRFDRIKSFNPNSSEAALKKVGMDTGGIIEKKSMLKALENEGKEFGFLFPDADLAAETRLTQAYESFQKSNIQGSRRTGWMSDAGGDAIGAAGAFLGFATADAVGLKGASKYIAGAAVGIPGYAVGKVIGGLAGMLVDVQGPKMAGKIFSAFSKTQNFKNNIQTKIAVAGSLLTGNLAGKLAVDILSIPGVSKRLIENGMDEDSEFFQTGELSISDDETLAEIESYVLRSDLADSVEKLLFIKKLREEGNINIQLLPAKPKKGDGVKGEKSSDRKRVNKNVDDMIKIFKERQ